LLFIVSFFFLLIVIGSPMFPLQNAVIS
jgi:hypothetical protein